MSPDLKFYFVYIEIQNRVVAEDFKVLISKMMACQKMMMMMMMMT